MKHGQSDSTLNITMTLYEKSFLYVKDNKGNLLTIKENEFDLNDYQVYVNIIKLLTEGLPSKSDFTITYSKIPADVFTIMKYSFPKANFIYLSELEQAEALNDEVKDHLAKNNEIEVEEIIIATESIVEDSPLDEKVGTLAAVTNNGEVMITEVPVKNRNVAEFLTMLFAYKKFARNSKKKNFVTFETENDFAYKAISEPFNSRIDAQEFVKGNLEQAGVEKSKIIHYIEVYEEIVSKVSKNEIKVVKTRPHRESLQNYALRFAINARKFNYSSKAFRKSAMYESMLRDYRSFIRGQRLNTSKY